MRWLLVVAVFLVAGCTQVAMVRGPGAGDPNAPVNESSGSIEYLLTPAWLEENRAEAYRQMKLACRGSPYRIYSESETGGERRWRTINYTCLPPPSSDP